MRPDDAERLREWLARERAAVDLARLKRNALAMQRRIERAAVQLAEYLELGFLPPRIVERLRDALVTFDRKQEGRPTTDDDHDGPHPPDEAHSERT